MKNEKVKHVWSVLASSSTIDQESNNITISVMESIQGDVQYDPKNKAFQEHGLVVPLKFEIITMLQKDTNVEEKLSLRVTVISPDGKELGVFKHAVSIPKNKKRMRVRTRMETLKIKGNGNYWFKVAIREQSSSRFNLVAEIPLEVNVKVKKLDTSSTS